MKRVLVFAALAVSSAAAPLACSSNKPNPPVTPTTPAVDAAADAEAGPIAMGAADAGAADGAPLAMGDASVVPPNLAELQDPAIDLAIKTAALKDAPGMAAEGAPGRATLAENEHFGMIVTMQPGRCYTIIAFSPPGQVAAVDMKLMAPPLYTVSAAQSGAGDKNLPVIGKGKSAQCPFLPLPVAYKIDVTAKKGAGRVGIQVFARNK